MILDGVGGFSSRPPIDVALIGAGTFGRSFLAQARHVAGLRVPVICEPDLARARAVLGAIGHERGQIAVCESDSAARDALGRGRIVVVPDRALVMDLPLDVVVEATGEPEVAAASAAAALDRGKHVAMVGKEADCVVGPLLARRAAGRGLVCTPVDGDQPRLLLRLIDWARMLGFDIVAAGKSSEHDLVFDAGLGTVTVHQDTVAAADLGALWALAPGRAKDTIAARARVLESLPQRTPPDYCEMAIVANATGLIPDRPDFHAPILRTPEVADAFCPEAEGGLLTRDGVLDVLNCLRRPDEASFAGGVFVVIRCTDRPTWRLLAAKGHVVSAEGTHAMIYHPTHLLGIEAPRTILEAVRGCGERPPVRPVVDMVGRASRELAAGTVLRLGARHDIENLDALLVEAAPVADDRPLPYYMAAGCRLRRAVAAGAPLTAADVEPPQHSTLWTLRGEQDQVFHQASANG